MGNEQSSLETLVMNLDFWRHKKVFLTGHTGFKGSWLSLWLQSMGAEVTGYALDPPTSPSMFEEAQVARKMTSVIGDIRDLAHLTQAIKQAQPEIVIHMAAQPLVRYSYEHPVETYQTNVMGTVHLLEAVRQFGGTRVVVNVTTDKCYENQEWNWGYRENEPMGGYDPYSNSKGCAELVTSAYRNSFFNPNQFDQHQTAIASARAGNVIGGGDWALDRLLPDFLRAILAQEAVKIRSPQAIRPWQHVLEPLSGYLRLAEMLWQHGPEFGGGWNFGPNDVDAKTVGWIVEKMTQLWGEGSSWALEGTPQPHEANYLKLDISKARMRLDWHPQWSLEQTLEMIVSWYKAWSAGKDMGAFSLSQIQQYISSLNSNKTDQ